MRFPSFKHLQKYYSHLIYQWQHLLLPILYPRRCPVCSQTLPYGRLICPLCHKHLPFIQGAVCYLCGKPVSSSEQEYCYDCRAYPKSFQAGRALFIYNEITRPPMMDFKYKNRRLLSHFFTNEIMKQHKMIFQEWQIQAIIPIPIHKNKQKKRGYNQAELLAKELSILLNLPCYSHILIRTIDTPPQKKFSPQARLNNMQQAFSLSHRYQTTLKNIHRVLLIDDIYTTGATMEACSRLLHQAGIKEVYIYSICIGLSRD